MEGKVTFYFYCFKVIFLLGFVTMFYAPGFFEEGELPPGPVSPGSDNMDCFMQQMCDALHDGSLGIDLNIDLGQVNSVESTVPYSGISTSNDTLLNHGEGRYSVFAASIFKLSSSSNIQVTLQMSRWKGQLRMEPIMMQVSRRGGVLLYQASRNPMLAY